MIDASHANSGKKPENQPKVVADIARQVGDGERRIIGVMIESNLVAGRQDLVADAPLTYGQSITDGCIGWDTTVAVLERLAQAVGERRAADRQGCGRGGGAGRSRPIADTGVTPDARPRHIMRWLRSSMIHRVPPTMRKRSTAEKASVTSRSRAVERKSTCRKQRKWTPAWTTAATAMRTMVGAGGISRKKTAAKGMAVRTSARARPVR